MLRGVFPHPSSIPARDMYEKDIEKALGITFSSIPKSKLAYHIFPLKFNITIFPSHISKQGPKQVKLALSSFHTSQASFLLFPYRSS